jgi:ABC-2 type transport system permease protein
MSGNSILIPVLERGWRGGFNNMLRGEFGKWWRSNLWWIQSLIWIGVINGILVGILWGEGTGTIEEGATLYCVFTGLFPNIAIIIIMQDVVVGEKEMGTGAWILSKPVSRQAFILSKWIANSVGVLVTMLLIPGIVAYLMFYLRFGSWINSLDFLTAWGILLVDLLYYLTLTLMLGTFFRHRGPVIGIPLALAFGQQMIFGLLPALSYVLPWVLAIPAGFFDTSIAASFILGSKPVSMLPFYITLGSIIIFLPLSLWRFEKEDF